MTMTLKSSRTIVKQESRHIQHAGNLRNGLGQLKRKKYEVRNKINDESMEALSLYSEALKEMEGN
jgi:hypothetical protein